MKTQDELDFFFMICTKDSVLLRFQDSPTKSRGSVLLLLFWSPGGLDRKTRVFDVPAVPQTCFTVLIIFAG